jgi:antitoxin component of RelBE/YafQ-DinJ toxin-antitoxin module
MARIDLRVSEEERKQIEAKAKQYNMTISEYIRLVSLNAEISVKVKEGNNVPLSQ